MLNDNHKSIALGQFLAILIAITAGASTTLVQEGISFPTLQSASVYALLAVVYAIINFYHHQNQLPTSKKLLQYALLAFLDVEANYVIVLAFRYTTITSVTLLDSFSIPMAMILTRLLGLAIYKTGHYGGAALCILGLSVLVAGDQFSLSHTLDKDTTTTIINTLSNTTTTNMDGNNNAPTAPLLGDMLVLLGATLYASCNVMQEYLLFDSSVSELLCFLGCFGCIIATTQGILLELPSALHTAWTGTSIIIPLLAFIIAMFAFYSLVPLLLDWSGASMLNISLLSSDLWSALIRVIYFGGFSVWSGIIFLLSLVMVAGGIFCYSMSGDAKHAVDYWNREDTVDYRVVPQVMPRYIPLNVPLTHDSTTSNNSSSTNSIGVGIRSLFDRKTIHGSDEVQLSASPSSP